MNRNYKLDKDKTQRLLDLAVEDNLVKLHKKVGTKGELRESAVLHVIMTLSSGEYAYSLKQVTGTFKLGKCCLGPFISLLFS